MSDVKAEIVSKSDDHLLRRTGGRIELWMKERLPYASYRSGKSLLPPWVEEALVPLRDNLRALEARPDEIIDARYVSVESSWRADVENVLFYNVRSDASFREASRHGLRFRYLAEEPPPPPGGRPGRFAHYHCYELVEADSPFLDECADAARYAFDLESSQKPELNDVWWGSVDAEWEVKKQEVEKFALRVHGLYPKYSGGRHAAVPSQVKKVLDGVACAMHRWENPHEVLVGKAAAHLAHLGVSQRSVREKMRRNRRALLGPAKTSRNWNPEDNMERLVAGELTLAQNEENQWRFEVRVLSVPSP